MSSTILIPCRVPWAISPSMSGLTLRHHESGSEPECTVVLGAGRLQDDGRTDVRRVEIAFELCYYARGGCHSDAEGVEAVGCTATSPIECDPVDYPERRAQLWRDAGYCPDPGFYVAQQSVWLAGIPNLLQRGFRHYVVDGRDGYIELIARRYRWREWLWREGERESASMKGPIVGEGESDS